MYSIECRLKEKEVLRKEEEILRRERFLRNMKMVENVERDIDELIRGNVPRARDFHVQYIKEENYGDI